MALVYSSLKLTHESVEPVIRRLEDDGDYVAAITIPVEDGGEDSVVEVLLTEEEVKELSDVTFNR